MHNQSTTILNKSTKNEISSPAKILNKSSDCIVKTTSPSLSRNGGVSLSNQKHYSLKHQNKNISRTRSFKRRHLRINDFCNPKSNTSSKCVLLQEASLNRKFEDLKETIVKFVTTEDPLEFNSLEIRLAQEIESSLSPNINNPKLSQQFIQATRELLNCLGSIYGAGGNKTQFHAPTGTTQSTILKERSATNLCYRDQYLKELIMNMLQGNYTNKIETELNKISSSVHSLNIVGKQRIHAIRHIVRTQTGIEPEAFKKLDQDLNDLQRTLSTNKLEVLKATSELEKVLSEHNIIGSNSLKSLQTNKSLEVLEIYNDGTGMVLRETELDNTSNKGCCKCYSRCGFNGSWSRSFLQSRNPSFQNIAAKEKSAEEIDILTKISSNNIKHSFEPAYNIIEQVRPEIQKIVDDELLNIREKSALIMKSINSGKCKNCVFTTNNFNQPSEICLSQKAGYEADQKTIAKEKEMYHEPLTHDLEESKDNEIEQKYLESYIDYNFHGDCCKIPEERVNYALPRFNKHMLHVSFDEINQHHPSELFFKDTILEQPTHSDYGNLPSSKTISKRSDEVVMNEMDLIKDQTSPRNMPKSWIKNDLLAKEIIEDLIIADQKMDHSHKPNDIISEIRENINKTESNKATKNNFYLEIENIADFLKEISQEITKFPYLLTVVNSNEKKELLEILAVINNSLNETYPLFNDVLPFITQEEQLSILVKQISNTFSQISNKLHLAPIQLRKQPISVLNPPKPFINTLAYLASTGYFKSTFISILTTNIGVKERDILKIHSNEKTCPMIIRSCISEPDTHRVHLNMCGQTFSKKTQPFFKHSQSLSILPDSTRNPNIRKEIEEFSKCLDRFEHYLELKLPEMTLQTISDMFLSLSTVLNDLPKRIKVNQLLSLNPPPDLIRALKLLYTNETVKDIKHAKMKSFDLLTVQNAADFLLTFSKLLQDAPLMMKNRPILELNPPPTLIDAINILISSQISDDSSQNDEDFVTLKGIVNESQDSFFDALESLEDSSLI